MNILNQKITDAKKTSTSSIMILNSERLLSELLNFDNDKAGRSKSDKLDELGLDTLVKKIIKIVNDTQFVSLITPNEMSEYILKVINKLYVLDTKYLKYEFKMQYYIKKIFKNFLQNRPGFNKQAAEFFHDKLLIDLLNEKKFNKFREYYLTATQLNLSNIEFKSKINQSKTTIHNLNLRRIVHELVADDYSNIEKDVYQQNIFKNRVLEIQNMLKLKDVSDSDKADFAYEITSKIVSIITSNMISNPALFLLYKQFIKDFSRKINALGLFQDKSFKDSVHNYFYDLLKKLKEKPIQFDRVYQLANDFGIFTEYSKLKQKKKPVSILTHR